MNIFDENMPATQLAILRRKRVPIKKIGDDIGRKAMTDSDIVPLLQPTFFTRDVDFYRPRLRHQGYCLVFLDIDDELVAEFVRRVLRHPSLNTKAKRMGLVVRVDPEGLTVWRLKENKPQDLPWQ